jgi:hypothetical protein
MPTVVATGGQTVPDVGAIVEFLSRDGRAARLAAQHGDDGTGHCRCCSAGGQAGRSTWPCSLAGLAARGAGLAASRAGRPRLLGPEGIGS